MKIMTDKIKNNIQELTIVKMYSTIKTTKEETTSKTGGKSNEIINFIPIQIFT